MPHRVAVVGSSGFFGSRFADFLASQEQFSVTAVTRANYAEAAKAEYDIVVNTAMPSRRFWAKQHPELDFIETVQKTSDLLYGWTFKRFIQISSVSARCERHTVYGRHKAAAEALCDRDDSLVIRLSNLYGRGMTKGALIDIKNGGPVYVDGESRYAFTDVHFAAGWVSAAIAVYDLNGVIEVGSKNTLSLNAIAAHMNKDVQFSGPVEVQEIMNPHDEYPDARKVLGFVSELP